MNYKQTLADLYHSYIQQSHLIESLLREIDTDQEKELARDLGVLIQSLCTAQLCLGPISQAFLLRDPEVDKTLVEKTWPSSHTH